MSLIFEVNQSSGFLGRALRTKNIYNRSLKKHNALKKIMKMQNIYVMWGHMSPCHAVLITSPLEMEISIDNQQIFTKS